MTELRVKCNDNVVLPANVGSKLEIPLNTYLYVDDLVLELKNSDYELLTTSEGVLISKEGIVTIPGSFNAGDVNGTDIIIRINAERGGENYSTEKTIHVSPAPEEEVSYTKSDFSVLSVKRNPDSSKYIFTADIAEGIDSIEINTGIFLTEAKPHTLQVVRRFEDGSFSALDEKCAEGLLQIPTMGASSIEISPVFRFCFGYENGEDCFGIRVPGNKEYSPGETFGFVGERIMSVGHVGFTGSRESCFVLTVPNGYYDVTLFKADEERSTIRINGGSVGTNVGNPGKGGRCGITPYSYRVEELHVTDGLITVSMDEKGRTLKALEIRRSPANSRRPHIFIGGDSTASCYYPIENTIPKPGRFQTGWGQVFGQYLTEEAVVINIAGGGTFAKSWYEMAFKGVMQHGMPGDVFLIEAGINDRTYSNIDEMKDYLSIMVDECDKAGIIPILVTAMQTAKFWKDRNGNELPEFGKPEASGLFAFAEAIREVAKEKNTGIIDVAAITGNLYEKLGRTFVAQNFHIYNPATKTEEDTLHLSYAGAHNVAGTVATELCNMLARNLMKNCRLSTNCFNDIIELTYAVSNESGIDRVVTVNRVLAQNKIYGV